MLQSETVPYPGIICCTSQQSCTRASSARFPKPHFLTPLVGGRMLYTDAWSDHSPLFEGGGWLSALHGKVGDGISNGLVA